jgi:hypothetical protein
MALGFVLAAMIRLAVVHGLGVDPGGALQVADPAAAQVFTLALLDTGQRETREGAGDPGTIVAPDSAAPLFTRVRSTERYMIALIREGYDRSATFRQLVDALQRSNVIVFVQPGYCAGGRIRSCLVGIGGSLLERHIRIKVDLQKYDAFRTDCHRGARASTRAGDRRTTGRDRRVRCAKTLPADCSWSVPCWSIRRVRDGACACHRT